MPIKMFQIEFDQITEDFEYQFLTESLFKDQFDLNKTQYQLFNNLEHANLDTAIENCTFLKNIQIIDKQQYDKFIMKQNDINDQNDIDTDYQSPNNKNLYQSKMHLSQIDKYFSPLMKQKKSEIYTSNQFYNSPSKNHKMSLNNQKLFQIQKSQNQTPFKRNIQSWNGLEYDENQNSIYKSPILNQKKRLSMKSSYQKQGSGTNNNSYNNQALIRQSRSFSQLYQQGNLIQIIENKNQSSQNSDQESQARSKNSKPKLTLKLNEVNFSKDESQINFDSNDVEGNHTNNTHQMNLKKNTIHNNSKNLNLNLSSHEQTISQKGRNKSKNNTRSFIQMGQSSPLKKIKEENNSPSNQYLNTPPQQKQLKNSNINQIIIPELQSQQQIISTKEQKIDEIEKKKKEKKNDGQQLLLQSQINYKDLTYNNQKSQNKMQNSQQVEQKEGDWENNVIYEEPQLPVNMQQSSKLMRSASCQQVQQMEDNLEGYLKLYIRRSLFSLNGKKPESILKEIKNINNNLQYKKKHKPSHKHSVLQFKFSLGSFSRLNMLMSQNPPIDDFQEPLNDIKERDNFYTNQSIQLPNLEFRQNLQLQISKQKPLFQSQIQGISKNINKQTVQDWKKTKIPLMKASSTLTNQQKTPQEQAMKLIQEFDTENNQIGFTFLIQITIENQKRKSTPAYKYSTIQNRLSFQTEQNNSQNSYNYQEQIPAQQENLLHINSNSPKKISRFGPNNFKEYNSNKDLESKDTSNKFSVAQELSKKPSIFN
ncbi:hypothetical protein PPERSA_11672 [Pseudocohnilembus persalinus]|uniref:Uncharacterized protein n=1 Tax=Pseudocohnilembus persalinus TaxID=266149 RepID=A0A0V0QAA5_PSEPJ|nr:hypothetical protein PPERSA_11672 [Pseudocohnilembus persalinus]|eukprot:KRW99071.1 hypothetical protein PPERSA_11672 [Pseudocohnilembus persalinus]